MSVAEGEVPLVTQEAGLDVSLPRPESSDPAPTSTVDESSIRVDFDLSQESDQKPEGEAPAEQEEKHTEPEHYSKKK